MKTRESLKTYSATNSLLNYPCSLDKFKFLLMHLYEEGYEKDDLISCVNTTYKGLEKEFGLPGNSELQDNNYVPYEQSCCPSCGGSIDTGFKCMKCGKQYSPKSDSSVTGVK